MKSILLILAVVAIGYVACDTPQPATGNGSDSTSVNSNSNMNKTDTSKTDTSGTKKDSMPNP